MHPANAQIGAWRVRYDQIPILRGDGFQSAPLDVLPGLVRGLNVAGPCVMAMSSEGVANRSGELARDEDFKTPPVCGITSRWRQRAS